MGLGWHVAGVGAAKRNSLTKSWSLMNDAISFEGRGFGVRVQTCDRQSQLPVGVARFRGRKSPQGNFVCDHAGLEINKFSALGGAEQAEASLFPLSVSSQPSAMRLPERSSTSASLACTHCFEDDIPGVWCKFVNIGAKERPLSANGCDQSRRAHGTLQPHESHLSRVPRPNAAFCLCLTRVDQLLSS